MTDIEIHSEERPELEAVNSFQAPKFYEGLGFTRLAAIPNYPKGYEQFFYIKELLVP